MTMLFVFLIGVLTGRRSHSPGARRTGRGQVAVNSQPHLASGPDNTRRAGRTVRRVHSHGWRNGNSCRRFAWNCRRARRHVRRLPNPNAASESAAHAGLRCRADRGPRLHRRIPLDRVAILAIIASRSSSTASSCVLRHHRRIEDQSAPPRVMWICRRVPHEVDFLPYWHEEPFAAHGDAPVPDAAPNLANRGPDSQCSL